MNMAPLEPSSAGDFCLLRLSAIGDVAHTVAVVRAIQAARPDARLTWLVGRVESAVAKLVSGVEVVVVDKRSPVREMLALRRRWRDRRFDALLHMQVSARSNVLSLGVRARERWGFDAARSKEGHRWVIDRRIPPAPQPGEHVLDGLMRFAVALGAPQNAPRRWDLDLPPDAEIWAQDLCQRAGSAPVLINVCASRPVKDWTPENFAAVARHVVSTHRRPVILCGGRSARETEMAAAILAFAGPGVIDQVGATTLPQLLALLARAAALISPDSGPVHLATAVGTPVIGLYGSTNLRRCGPSQDVRWCVNRRDAAAQQLLRRDPATLGWAEVVPGGMALIRVEDVIERVDALFATGTLR